MIRQKGRGSSRIRFNRQRKRDAVVEMSAGVVMKAIAVVATFLHVLHAVNPTDLVRCGAQRA